MSGIGAWFVPTHCRLGPCMEPNRRDGHTAGALGVSCVEAKTRVARSAQTAIHRYTVKEERPMTTPRTTPNRTPPGSPRITLQVPANTPLRRVSKVLATSMGYPAGPTLVLLTIGGPSHMSNTLIRDWQDGAIVAECNFCAIEVGEAAGSDIELPELLHAHVPQDAHLYLVQRDAKVSIEEVEQVREVLDRLEIPLASDEPLNADDVRTWVFPVLDEVAPPEHVRAPDYEVAAVRQKLEQNRVKSFELNREIEQLQAFIVAMRETGASPGEENEAPTVIMSAFNELQFSKHWQSVAGTPAQRPCIS